MTRQLENNITLIGMSGVGKTHISQHLEKIGWEHISCDFEIAHTYLKDALVREGLPPVETPHDIGSLSSFIGKLGSAEKSGLNYKKFKEHQKLYYDAECAALRAFVEKSRAHQDRLMINDSTGSLCEIEDEALIEDLGRCSFFVYLRAGDKQEEEVLRRAKEYPKPLFFPPSFFDIWLEEYLDTQDGIKADDIDPDHFAIWVFPKLFESRLPKYEALSQRFGMSLDADTLLNVEDGHAFLDVVRAG